MSDDPTSVEDCLHHCRGSLTREQYELALRLIKLHALKLKVDALEQAQRALLDYTEGGWINAAEHKLDDRGRLAMIANATVEQFATWLKKVPRIEPDHDLFVWALLESQLRQRLGEVSLLPAIGHLLEHADRDTLQKILGLLVKKLDAETVARWVAAGGDLREEDLRNRRATIRLVSDATVLT
jgi:hypothetical protein